MDYSRSARVEEAIKEEISDIIRNELKDPRIGFVTVVDVKLTVDLRQATIFFSIWGDEWAKKETLAGLESAKGYIRSELERECDLDICQNFFSS